MSTGTGCGDEQRYGATLEVRIWSTGGSGHLESLLPSRCVLEERSSHPADHIRHMENRMWFELAPPTCRSTEDAFLIVSGHGAGYLLFASIRTECSSIFEG